MVADRPLAMVVIDRGKDKFALKYFTIPELVLL